MALMVGGVPSADIRQAEAAGRKQGVPTQRSLRALIRAAVRYGTQPRASVPEVLPALAARGIAAVPRTEAAEALLDRLAAEDPSCMPDVRDAFGDIFERNELRASASRRKTKANPHTWGPEGAVRWQGNVGTVSGESKVYAIKQGPGIRPVFYLVYVPRAKLYGRSGSLSGYINAQGRGVKTPFGFPDPEAAELAAHLHAASRLTKANPRSFPLSKRAVRTERVLSERGALALLVDAENWAVYGRPPSLRLYPYLVRTGIAGKKIDKVFWLGEVVDAILRDVGYLPSVVEAAERL
jgi:hypothetical protein